MKTRILLALLVTGAFALPVSADRQSESDFQTRLVNLKAADARQASILVQKTVMRRGRTGYEQSTNSVVLTGPPTEVQTAERLLAELDASASRESGTRSAIIRVPSAPGDFLDLVHAMVSPGTSLSFDAAAEILVIRGKASDITEVERLVKVVSEDRVPNATRTAKPLTLSFFFIQGLMGPENQPRSKPQSHRRMHQPDPRDEAVRAKLEKPVTLNANRESLETVLKQLCAAVDLDMVVKWRELEAVGISSDENIELALRAPVPLRQALALVLEQVCEGDDSMTFIVREGLLRIGSRRESYSDTYVEAYDVQELTQVVPRFATAPEPVAPLAGGGGMMRGGEGGMGGGMAEANNGMANPFMGGGDDSPSPSYVAPTMWQVGDEDSADYLMDLIRQTITPEEWVEVGGTHFSIQFANGMLIVKQTPENHREIAELLELLTERQRAMRASVSRIEPPAMLDPVMSALQEHGFRNATLLAPLKVAVGRNGRFDLEGMAAQIDRMLKVHVEGRARQADTGAVELTLQASIGPKVELPGTHRGPEPMFRVNSTVTAPLGDYIVLATSPGATDYGQAIALVVRVDQAD
jgi:hypothetical protein